MKLCCPCGGVAVSESVIVMWIFVGKLAHTGHRTLSADLPKDQSPKGSKFWPHFICPAMFLVYLGTKIYA